MKRPKHILTGLAACGLALFTLTQTASAITTSGVMPADEIWSGTVSLLGDVTVPVGVTLTILPGTTVQCDENSDITSGGIDNSRIEIIVQGSLSAVGTPANPILFTSWPLTPPGVPRDWYGLRLAPASTNNVIQMQNCVVEDAVDGVNVESGGIQPFVQCTFRNNFGYGLHAKFSATLNSCVIQNNYSGAFADSGTTLVVSNCNVSFNSYFGLIGSGSSVAVCYNSMVLSNGNTGVYSFDMLSFTGGACNGNGGDGIGSVHNSYVTNSSFIGNTGTGIDSYLQVVTNCISMGNKKVGMGGSWAMTIQNCTITQNQMSGVSGGWLPMAITGSTISQNLSGGILARDNASITMAGCLVQNNSGFGVQTGGGVTITNCTILNNTGAGIRASSLNDTNGIQGNIITGNNPGILFYANSGPVQPITGNKISGNLNYEFSNQGTAAIMATNNFWGEPTTSELIATQRNLSKIYDSRDDASVGQVIVNPYLTSDPFAVPPTIDTNTPTDLVAAQGGTATFTVTATSGAPYTYQWRQGTGNLSGQTNSFLTINPVQPGDAATNYNVIVANGNGSVTSRWATLTVLLPPAITSQPTNLTLLAGSTAAFHVTASGSATLAYQWQKGSVNLVNGGRITGALSPDLTIATIQASDAATYRCVVTNLVGSATSSNAILTLPVPPTITTNPATRIVSVGASATFNVAVTGSTPLNYQWFFNGVAINGAMGSSLNLSNVGSTNVGQYMVTVWNTAGTNTSTAADLWLNALKMYAGVNVYGPVGGNCVVQYATNLNAPVTWTQLQSVTIVTNPTVIIDYGSADKPQRFYQTVPQ